MSIVYVMYGKIYSVWTMCSSLCHWCMNECEWVTVTCKNTFNGRET